MGIPAQQGAVGEGSWEGSGGSRSGETRSPLSRPAPLGRRMGWSFGPAGGPGVGAAPEAADPSPPLLGWTLGVESPQASGLSPQRTPPPVLSPAVAFLQCRGGRGGVCQGETRSPRPHKSKRRHMVSRASVCGERAGRLWRSHPRACPGPAQSPGSPPQDTGIPKTDRLEPGTAPTPPRSLEHIRVGTEPAPIRPSLPTAWTTGEGRRHAPAERWGGGSPLPSPPVPPPPSGARLGGGCPGFSPADGERAGQGLCPLAAMLVRGSPGAHRSGGCSL